MLYMLYSVQLHNIGSSPTEQMGERRHESDYGEESPMFKVSNMPRAHFRHLKH